MSRSLSSQRPRRLAVDIGGTFTDFALDDGTRRYSRKRLTTPDRPEESFLAGVQEILAEAGLHISELDTLIHGTTLVTNAVIERRGVPTALITTKGHRDVLEIANEGRFDQYDLMLQRPAPLIPRDLRFRIEERLDATGAVRQPLDEGALEALLPSLEGVRSVAIAFLHAYANPVHELQAAKVLSRLRPDLDITLSHDVCPEIREYERISTTAINAYVKPLVDGYLRRLEDGLAQLGFSGAFYLITSAGGLALPDIARRYPVRLIESGPAGGAIFAAEVARSQNLPNVLAFDMGGTTAKLCIIENGQPHMAQSFEVDRTARFLKGSGFPLRIPAVELVEIGAGGCSLASVDDLGRITVGPRSASAVPGPASYGQGGDKATVTDADVVLGLIDPAAFAGGQIPLDVNAAHAAIDRDIGQAAGLETPASAHGIYEIVCENMASAARVHASERGVDLRNSTMIAFGGAAPLHAVRVAQKIGVKRIVIPADASVGSAVGFLATPVSYDLARSVLLKLDGLDTAMLQAALDGLAKDGKAVVDQAAPGEEAAVTSQLRCRYTGQGHEIAIAEDGPLGPAALRARFEEAYIAHYGRIIGGAGIEIVGLSVNVSTRPIPCSPVPQGEQGVHSGPALTAIYDPQQQQPIQVPRYLRSAIGSLRIVGPALIGEAGTTSFVPHGFTLHQDADGVLVIEENAE